MQIWVNIHVQPIKRRKYRYTALFLNARVSVYMSTEQALFESSLL